MTGGLIHHVFTKRILVAAIIFLLIFAVCRSFFRNSRIRLSGYEKSTIDACLFLRKKQYLFSSKAQEKARYSWPKGITDWEIEDKQKEMKILILSMVSSIESRVPNFVRNLCSLSYPHDQISLYLLNNASSEKSVKKLLEYGKILSQSFHTFKVIESQTKFVALNSAPKDKMDKNMELRYLSHLSKSRNNLFADALKESEFDYVLWLDADIEYFSADIIQQLLSAGKEIVAPACMYINEKGMPDIYDKGTYQETQESLRFLAKQDESYLMLPSFDTGNRRYLNDLRTGERLVPLDGIGSCMFMVKAKLFKDGLVFPSFIYKHHIDTEGFALIAKDMGNQPYGMPYVEVYQKITKNYIVPTEGIH